MVPLRPFFHSFCAAVWVMIYKTGDISAWTQGPPHKGTLKGDKLYGRGGADDGYSIYAAITAIRLLKANGISHGRCVIMIESSEESGSPDLPYYVKREAAKIGR
jgi:acetylornithine deacetylase/succinyl-diaminopimelate desuccinylase-like protein